MISAAPPTDNCWVLDHLLMATATAPNGDTGSPAGQSRQPSGRRLIAPPRVAYPALRRRLADTAGALRPALIGVKGRYGTFRALAVAAALSPETSSALRP